MRVRVLKDCVVGGRTFRVGEVVEINPETASHLMRTKLVMQDKSLDGASETKVSPLGTTIMREGFVTETGLLPGEGVK